MSALLPLYPDPSAPPFKGGWASPVDDALPLAVDPGCSRCSLGVGEGRCIRAEVSQAPGQVLFVLAGPPGILERQSKRPVLGQFGYWLRNQIAATWRGPVVYDHAVRCEARAPDEAQVQACRGFLAANLSAAHPARVLALGETAFRSLTGRPGERRGVGWIRRPARAPVLKLYSTREAEANRFLRREFEADLAWALETDASAWTPPSPASYQVVETADEARAAAVALRDGFAYDCEWFGEPHSREHHLLSVACAALGEDHAYVWGRDGLRRADVVAPLRELMASSPVVKHGHELKADLRAIALGLGVRPAPEGCDTLLWSKLLDPEGPGYLADLAERVGMGGYKEEAEGIRSARKKMIGRMRAGEQRQAAAGQGALFQATVPECPWLTGVEIQAALDPGVDVDSISFGLIDPPVLYRYNARDAVATARLVSLQALERERYPDQAATWREVVAGAVHAYSRVEEWGMPVDRGQMVQVGAHLGMRLAGLEQRARTWAGPDFSPGSNRDVGDLLFKKLGLPCTRRTPTGQPGVDDEVLQALEDAHPVVPVLREYRSVAKLKGTYVDGFLGLIRADGRIHPRILIDGARSGRPSCQAPNLQNLPRAETDDGRAIRRLFAAPRGRVLWEVDYSQLELRIACMLSGDEEMLRIFQAGGDFHRETARLISQTAWGISPDQITDAHRSAAKTINFSVVYGKTIKGLALAIGCSDAEAARIHGAILGRFRRLSDWIQGRVEFARQEGGCWTWWNGHRARWRPLPDVGLEGDDAFRRGRRESAERAAFNTPVQGTGADFLLASLGEFVRWIERSGSTAKVCITVHDSMLIEADEGDDAPVSEATRIMTSWPSEGVQIKVDAKRGPSWGDLEKAKIQPTSRGTIGGVG